MPVRHANIQRLAVLQETRLEVYVRLLALRPVDQWCWALRRRWVPIAPAVACLQGIRVNSTC